MATLMLEGGADIRFIQQMLGHAELSSTEIYTHVAIRKLQQIHAATHPGATLERKASGVATENTGPDDDEQKAELLDALDEEAEEEIRIDRTRGRKATEGSFCRAERGKARGVRGRVR